jgi:hypothetical protein
MNNRSFSKGFPNGYLWISIILLIVFLCFASVYNSYGAALNTSKNIEAGITKDLTRTIERDNGLDAKSGHFFTVTKKADRKIM